MLKYILKRLALALVSMWILITLTFVLMHSIPGDPFADNQKLPATVRKNLMRYYHLDKPKTVQYWIYVKSIARFDFGPSMRNKTRTINDMLKDKFPVSMHLGLQAMIIAAAFGLVLGVIAAIYHNRAPDYFSMVLAVIGISVPSFILATILMNFVSVKWGLLPVAQWKSWRHTILPSISLAMLPMAYIARLTRSSMLEVLGQDYIKTARSKGLSQGVVIIKHAVRNAILPVVTVLGILITNIVTGSFVIESIFGVPGMGDMFVQSIFDRDYTAILGTTVFYATLLILMTLLIDVLYTIIDPRIKFTGGTK